MVKAVLWGVNIPDWHIEWHAKSTFFVLSGMLSLSFFIHNIIISIMRSNRHQEHNVRLKMKYLPVNCENWLAFLQGRDLSIAFGLVTFTYLFLGVVFYISFPLAKNCIEDVSKYQELAGCCKFYNKILFLEYPQQFRQNRCDGDHSPLASTFPTLHSLSTHLLYASRWHLEQHKPDLQASEVWWL